MLLYYYQQPKLVNRKLLTIYNCHIAKTDPTKKQKFHRKIQQTFKHLIYELNSIKTHLNSNFVHTFTVDINIEIVRQKPTKKHGKLQKKIWEI